MATELDEAPVALDAGDDELGHIFCLCNPDIALCGKDITGDEIVYSWDDGILPCVVCEALEGVICSRCGAIA